MAYIVGDSTTGMRGDGEKGFGIKAKANKNNEMTLQTRTTQNSNNKSEYTTETHDINKATATRQEK